MAEAARPLPQSPRPPASSRVGSPLRDLPFRTAAANDGQEPGNEEQEIGDSPIPAFNRQPANDDQEEPEEIFEADRRSQLRAAQQQRRVAAERADEDEKAQANVASAVAGKVGDTASAQGAVNQVLSKVFGVTVLAFIFLFWPVKLVIQVGLRKIMGQEPVRVSWDDVVPGLSEILPETYAMGIATFGLVTDVILIVASILFDLVLFIVLYKAMLGPLANTVLGLLGIPLVLP